MNIKMDMEMWCECANTLREWAEADRAFYRLGLDLGETRVGKLVDMLMFMLEGGTEDWAYDVTARMNWVVEWVWSEPGAIVFERRVEREGDIVAVAEYQRVYIADAADLYNFVCEMRSLGWPEELPAEWGE